MQLRKTLAHPYLFEPELESLNVSDEEIRKNLIAASAKFTVRLGSPLLPVQSILTCDLDEGACTDAPKIKSCWTSSAFGTLLSLHCSPRRMH
jgi:hypothetical protein